MRRHVESADRSGYHRQEEGLHSENPDIGNDPPLRGHRQLQHEHEGGHQGDQLGAEIGILQKRHKSQNRNVEIRPSAPRVNATAKSSGTRNKRILALVVSIRTMTPLSASSFSIK